MDSSPKSSKPISNSTHLAVPNPIQAQGFPFFSYISNLSPEKPENTALVAEGFPGINSPTLELRSPQTNPKGNHNCLKGDQFTRSSYAKSPKLDENVEDEDIVDEKAGMAGNELSSYSQFSPHEGSLTKPHPHTKASSPPSNRDDCSAIVKMDGEALASSVNLSPKNSDSLFQSQNDLDGSNEAVDKTENKDDPFTEKLEIGVPTVLIDQADKNDPGNSISDLKSFESDKNSPNTDMAHGACSKIDHGSSEDNASDNQHVGELKAETAGSGQVFEGGFTSHLGDMQTAQDSGVRVNAVQCIASSGNDHYSKVGRHQHGISRRLQFEDVHSKKMTDLGFQVSSGAAGYHRLSTDSADSDVPESASLYKPVGASNMSFANINHDMLSPQDNGNHYIQGPKPSGIGLHLNSLIGGKQLNYSASKISGKSEEESLDLGKKYISTMSFHLNKNYSISPNMVGGASFSRDSNMCDNPALGASSVESPYSMKPLFEPLTFKQNMQIQSNYSDKRKSNAETLDSYGDFVPSSPKKKRRNTMDAGDSNGCKRCNCKKTKCLKLYCDCFAAGIYCAGPCACQGCFNRPEYEDTVLETRQQIESRNPIAFAPKIIKHSSEAPTKVCVDDGDFTPSSARHKRGCNCKKSKCLKKYCECYQANVGCSDGCRCEGCDNAYGRKDAYGITNDLISNQGNSENLDNSMERMLSKDGLLQNELYSAHNLTPLTPQFQCPINERGTSRPWFPSGRYLQSPESDLKFISPLGQSPVPAKDPDSRDMNQETHTGIMDLVSYQQGFNYSDGRDDTQFSPYVGAGSVDHVTPAAFPNPQDWVGSNSRGQTFAGNHHFSSESSLRWRRSPMTSLTQLGASKFQEAAEFEDRLRSIMDDDTPDILKEDPVPTSGVKVSSPNKKRVSPPHGRLSELSSFSSSGMRTCRKFVLKGIPAMSPRTPHSQSKHDPDQNAENSQSSSSCK